MIREAQVRDRDRIEQLYKILIPNDPAVHVLNERIEDIERDPNNFLFVYDDGEKATATVLLSFCMDPMFGNRPYAVVENIIVDPASQGNGIGKALLHHIDHCCKERDCREILLLSHMRRTEAHRFFERCGYSAIAKGFKRYLD